MLQTRLSGGLKHITQEDSVAETIRKVGLEKLLSIGEIIDKYYGDLTEAFNEEIAETLPEHRPYDCKIELEPDAPLYKGAIYPTSPKEEKALKEYIDENLAGVYKKVKIFGGLPCIVRAEEIR